MIIYIYEKSTMKIHKALQIVSYEDFKKNPKIFFPQWNPETFLYSEFDYVEPVLENGVIKVKTIEQMIVSGNVIELTESGEQFVESKIKKIEKPKNLLNPIWNMELSQWEEDASYEELYEDYYKKIDNLKQEILANGYDWRGHKQKCREKDVTFLGNAIAGMEDVNPLGTMMWAFSDMDITSLNLAELKELRAYGMGFVNLVYGAEQVLKHNLPKVDVSITDYLNSIEFLKTKM